MNKQLHPLQSFGGNYLYILKLSQVSEWIGNFTPHFMMELLIYTGIKVNQIRKKGAPVVIIFGAPVWWL